MADGAIGGYCEDMFLEEVIDLYQCGICLGVLRNPHECSNGHKCCLTCISQALVNRRVCPTCNVHLEPRTLINSMAIHESINELQVKCDIPGCTWTGELRTLETHKVDCGMITVDCPLHFHGCCACNGQILRKDLDSHLLSCKSTWKAVEVYDVLSQKNGNLGYELAMMNASLTVGYVGRFDHYNRKTGPGIEKFENGGTYCGHWNDDLQHGRGVYRSSMYTCIGQFENGRFSSGVVNYPDGTWFKGTRFQDNCLLMGQGECRYKRNQKFGKFTGEFYCNLRNGFGIDTLSNDDRYEGQWDGDILVGLGKVMYKNGNIYEGTFDHDLRCHGQGKLTFADGGVYEGQFEKDLRKGRGKMVYVDGNTYVGQWCDGMRHGSGRVEMRDGNIYNGMWRLNKRHGDGKLSCRDGAVYEGQWEDDKIHGQGKLSYANGKVFEGQWENGKRHGQGTLMRADCVMKGQWWNGHLNGAVTTTWLNTQVVTINHYMNGRLLVSSKKEDQLDDDNMPVDSDLAGKKRKGN